MKKILGKLVIAVTLAASFCCIQGCDLLDDTSMEHVFEK